MLRNNSAFNFVLKLKAAPPLPRLKLDPDMPILPPPPTLFNEPPLSLYRHGDSLSIGNPGLAHICLHLELAKQPFHDDLKVEFAHP